MQHKRGKQIARIFTSGPEVLEHFKLHLHYQLKEPLWAFKSVQSGGGGKNGGNNKICVTRLMHYAYLSSRSLLQCNLFLTRCGRLRSRMHVAQGCLLNWHRTFGCLNALDISDESKVQRWGLKALHATQGGCSWPDLYPKHSQRLRNTEIRQKQEAAKTVK